MKRLAQFLNHFWFDPQSLLVSALFRLTVGMTLTYHYFVRALDFEYLFGEKGLVPYSLAVTMVPEFYKPPLTLFSASEVVMNYWSWGFVGLLAILTLGLGGRILALFTFVVHTMFIQRNFVAIYGPDFIASCWLFYMCFLKTDGYLSLRQIFKRQPLWPLSWKTAVGGDILNSVGIRFIQIQLCVIYGYGGTEKLRGITWWRGDAIWNTLGNGQLVNTDYGFLAGFPYLVAAMTFTTLLWEIYFPVLVWNRNMKSFVLGFGVLLHLGIGISMNIPIFSLLMIFSYLSFFGGLDQSMTKKHNI